MKRRNTDYLSFNPWPSFVDTMFIIMSILVLFFIAQFYQIYLIKEMKSKKTVKTESNIGKVQLCWMTLEDKVTFNFGNSELLPTGKKILKDNFANIDNILKQIKDGAPDDYDIFIEISGHTDNVVMGQGELSELEKEMINLDMSSRRANKIIKFLLSDPEISKKINKKNIKSAGFSQWQNKYPNDNEDHRSKNRRIEIKVFAMPKIRS